MRPVSASLAFAAALLGTAALAATPAPMKISVEGIDAADSSIPAKFALCQATPDGKSKPGTNVRPAIHWSGEPSATKSFSLVVTDPDVPADFSDAGKDGKVVKADAKRQTFYHWALADMPATTHEIPGGDATLAPDFGTPAKGSLEKYVSNPSQYGGPCPPWNDERVHHYHFTIYALDVPALDVSEAPSAQEVEAAAEKHAIGSGSIVGTYTLNKTLRK